MDNSYTVPNVYSLHGGAAASDDTVGVSVQIDIKVFTVGQQGAGSCRDFPQDFSVISPHTDKSADTWVGSAYRDV